jgi:dihydrofolate synthase/folylpolyglutamate synthase
LQEKLKKYKKPVQVSESVPSALQAIKKISNPNDLVCITGSIFTVAEAKKYFQYEKSFSNSGNSPRSG